LPELLRGGGFFVEPGDVEAVIAAMRALTTDGPARRAMADRARERSGGLSWDRGAAMALAAIREAAA
jgi:glycosyltransferase involved in cell wall biosynthesis